MMFIPKIKPLSRITFGFKSCSAVGKHMAAFMANNECPEILKPFNLKRYQEHKLMGETAALVNYSPDN